MVKIGDKVNITNVAIIQSTYDENKRTLLLSTIYIKGTDKFVSDRDQKEICQNLNANSKYYVEFTDLYHFSSFTKSGLDKAEPVRRAIITYLTDKNLSNTSTRTIISTNQGCE